VKRSTDAIYSLRAGGERLHASEVFLVYNRQYDTRESPQVNQKIEPGCVVLPRRGRFSAGGVPGRIRSQLPGYAQRTFPAVISQSSADMYRR
jgi:hypothetical protein